MKIANIVGARPNLVKIAPLLREMRKHPEIQPLLLHTGQHYDEKLSDVFFRQMGIPEPDANLEVGSGSHAWQTAEILKRVEPFLLEHKPDLVLVVGDVNSTVAASLAAVKLGIRVAHVEAGLRSFDRAMPEEINRVLTDAIADYLFVTEEDAIDNLMRVHSFSESTLASVCWWLDLLSEHRVPYLFVVPNVAAHDGTRLLTLEPAGIESQDFMPAILSRGYRLAKKRAKYSVPGVQKCGVSPTHYYLVEFPGGGPMANGDRSQGSSLEM